MVPWAFSWKSFARKDSNTNNAQLREVSAMLGDARAPKSLTFVTA
jgi:hypothetical protein